MSDMAEDGCQSHADWKVVVWSHRKAVWSREKHMKMVDANLLPGARVHLFQYTSTYKRLNKRKIIVAANLRFLFGTIRCILIITGDRGRQVAK